MRRPITRREALGAVASAVPATAVTANAATPLIVGLATTEFRDHSNASLAKELSGEGVRTIQLFLTQTDSNYWKYGQRSDLRGLSPERSKEIAGTYRSAGISIHSIGVYVNLVHPDAAERKANLAYFEAMMRVGDSMGVRTFVTEAGHYRPAGTESQVPYYFQPEVWHAAVATVKELAQLAAAHNATVLLEPIHRSIFASAKRTRVFLEEVGSPRIAALLDAANLLEVNDVGEMFDQLQPWIRCLHAKDRKLHVDAGVPTGQGDLDYPKLVTLAAQRTPAAPLILEYVGSRNFRPALAHLRNVIRQAGLAEASSRA